MSVRVLVVDAAQASRLFLVARLEADPGVQAVRSVASVEAALAVLREGAADVVLMDDGTPALSGFEATRRIMETTPVPIVLCIPAAAAGESAFRSLEAGAVACIEKPSPENAPERVEAAVAHLLQTVKLMAEVKVVRRWSQTRGAARRPALPDAPVKVVGIGASTGGPLALQTILAELPADFPAPLLVVQHIARGFLVGMGDWLRQTCGLKVQVAAHGLTPLPGHVYLAPDDFHMGVGAGGRILLSHDAPDNGLRPSVAFLFRTLAEVHGPDAVGVLLTGMGKDGAAELKLMRDRGAMTVVQDSASSVVHGMPGEAIALGAAMQVAPADRIADILVRLARRRNRDEETLP